MSELMSKDLTDKVYDRLGGTVPIIPLEDREDRTGIDLHAIVKATLEELAEAGFLTVESVDDV